MMKPSWTTPSMFWKLSFSAIFVAVLVSGCATPPVSARTGRPPILIYAPFFGVVASSSRSHTCPLDLRIAACSAATTTNALSGSSTCPAVPI
jgi:hypothetical protein